MLYRVLKRLIENSQTDGLAEKIDIFYAAGKLTDTEYTELTGMLS
jgi:transcription initiation factor IIE alpha subunit